MRPDSGLSEAYGERAQAVHERAITPAQDGRVGGKIDIREAVQESPDGDLPFHPCQRRAYAVVDAVPERDVAGGLAGDIQPVRVSEAVAVAVAASSETWTSSPAGIRVPPESTGSAVNRSVAMCTGPS
jgi:hypothetical protein